MLDHKPKMPGIRGFAKLFINQYTGGKCRDNVGETCGRQRWPLMLIKERRKGPIDKRVAKYIPLSVPVSIYQRGIRGRISLKTESSSCHPSKWF